MGKKSRNARRQARKAKRQERRENLEALIDSLKSANIQSLPDESQGEPPFIEKFNEVWPVLKAALKFAMDLKLTGEKADASLEEIYNAGEAIANGGGADAQGVFIEKFKKAWSIIEKALELVQILTPKNVDKVLDDVIEIGDWIAGE